MSEQEIWEYIRLLEGRIKNPENPGYTAGSIPLNAWIPSGAAIGMSGFYQGFIFRDANVDIIDTQIVLPTGISFANVYLDTWWWSASSGSIVVVDELRKITDTAALSSTADNCGSLTIALTANTVKKSTIPASGSALASGQALALRMYREGNHASDNLAASAYLLAVGLRPY